MLVNRDLQSYSFEQLQEYVREIDAFIERIENKAVRRLDSTNVWYNSYIDCVMLDNQLARRNTLRELVAKMRFEIFCIELRLDNFRKYGNFAWSMRDEGYRSVFDTIRLAHCKMLLGKI